MLSRVQGNVKGVNMNLNNVPTIDVHGMFLSARELARVSGATKPQLAYWSKAKYLERRAADSYEFPLSQVPKARVMSVLVNKVGMDAEKAFKLSKKFLERYHDAPDAAKAVLAFLNALYVRFDDIIDLMSETKFQQEVLATLAPEENDARE
jgi:hypothetical protein